MSVSSPVCPWGYRIVARLKQCLRTGLPNVGRFRTAVQNIFSERNRSFRAGLQSGFSEPEGLQQRSGRRRCDTILIIEHHGDLLLVIRH